ncbi:MAG: hypothetical protein K8R53_08635 [Bacteroidales bacterium]|nr:hypothetical protein [Bacteroidales bacterium]
MNISPIIEIVIALVFIYFILSIAVSGIVELINKWRSRRGRLLYYAIDKVLNDPQNKNWSDLFFNHPLVNGLRKNYKTLPSYISSGIFAGCIIDMIIQEGKSEKVIQDESGAIHLLEEDFKGKSIEALKKGLEKLHPGDFKKLITTFINESSDIEDVNKALSQWYDNYMERVTGWFKWSARKITFVVSIFIVLLFNLDSINITREVWNNPETRQGLVAAAMYSTDAIDSVKLDSMLVYIDMMLEYYNTTNQIENSMLNPNETLADSAGIIKSDSTGSDLKDIKNDIEQLKKINSLLYTFLDFHSLPFGWKTNIHWEKEKNKEHVTHFKTVMYNIDSIYFLQVIGWLITIMAISFGAPFWFNTLNRLVNVRNAGIKPKEKT